MAHAVNLVPGSLNSIVNFGSALIITAGDMSADIDSGPYNINQFPCASLQIDIGAGATGEFFIQTTNVYDPVDGDWITLPFVDSDDAPVTFTTSGSAGSYFVNITKLGSSFLRVIYDFTSGTGTCNVRLTLKGA